MGLAAVIEKEIGQPVADYGQPFWCCPLHPDANASLTMYTKDGKERWKCFGCSAGGDAIDFLRKSHPELSFAEARDRLDSSLRGQPRPKATRQDANLPRAKSQKPGTLQASCGWWKVVVRGSAKRIWQPQFGGLDWLRLRGLKEGTVREAKLGVNEDGIVIPWFSSYGELQAVNVRRFNRVPKYRMFAGSARGVLYPDVRLDYRKPLILCEGELDTLLARQEAGDVGQAVTLGSAGDRPAAPVLTHLALCRLLFVAFDADEAGDKAFRRLRSVLKHVRRIRPPDGQDLTDVHHSIGLRKWITEKVRSGKAKRGDAERKGS